MVWIRAAQFPLTDNLTQLDTQLRLAGIPHRIVEEGGLQVVWLADESYRGQFELIINSLSNEESREQTEASQAHALVYNPAAWWQSMVQRCPVTVVTVILGLIGYLLVAYFSQSSLIKGFLFQPFSVLVETHDYWRLITPTYLHFSFLHFLFNSLWIWEIGRRIEHWAGSVSLVAIFLFIALGSNYIQFWSGKGILFGGLSGVVYGYLGFVLISGRKHPDPVLQMPPGIYVFMLLWLALGLFGFIDVFIDGRVANGAHVGGLALGLLVGFVYSSFRKGNKL